MSVVSKRRTKKKKKTTVVSEYKRKTVVAEYPAMHEIKDWVKIIREKTPQGLAEEYRQLPRTLGPNQTHTAFTNNMDRNRYIDVPCLDQSRVVLRDSPTGDYIHASNVTACGDKRIILSQGPLTNTVTDFWRMVWQERVALIVMLCSTVECNQEKCAQYWPLKKLEQMTCGPFEITTTDSWTKALFDTRDESVQMTKMTIRRDGGEPRRVLHAQYTSWPDRETPEQTDSIPRLLTIIEGYKQQMIERYKDQPAAEDPPNLVHCSAGIGRTGTLVTIQLCLEKLKQDSSLPHIASIVKHIRRHRHLAVQTESQFLFIYSVLLDYCFSRKIITSGAAGFTLEEFISKFKRTNKSFISKE